jgi:proteic killer suppression protein
MIRSFKCSETARIFRREGSRRLRAIERLALRKLLLIEGSNRIDDLRVPPGNRLEKLRGDRAGQWSIRINDQWRICFRWDHGACDVEIVDYH